MSLRAPRLADRYLHDLSVVVAPAETGSMPARPDRPYLTLLIDGHDILDAVEPRGWMGFPAGDHLGVDSMPLLATAEPRWVGLAQCPCGIPGCGTLAALVTRAGSITTWSDLRRFVGVFDAPLTPLKVRAEDGASTRLPHVIRFDTEAYAATLRAAAARYRRG